VSVREEPEKEHDLRVKKSHDSLYSYSIEVLGPRVGSGPDLRVAGGATTPSPPKTWAPPFQKNIGPCLTHRLVFH
jgi:hypothetical protein